MIDASSLIIPRFHDVLGDVMAHGHTHYWLFGGRGSTKSSFISLAIVLVMLANPGANAVVVRRFSNTLRDSMFQQMTWAIAALGLERWFRARISPMELTYVPTGQRIVFRSADDPLKLKGVKFTRGYCAVVWFEELDQFDGIEAVRSILNSLRRGGDDFWIFYSYNPPRTLRSWVNREKLERERRSTPSSAKALTWMWQRRTLSGWERPSSRRRSTCARSMRPLGETSIWAMSPAQAGPSSTTSWRSA